MTMFTPVQFASLEDVESFAVFNAVSDTAVPHVLTGEPPEDIVGWFDGIPVYAIYAHGEDGEGESTMRCYGDIPRLILSLRTAGKLAAHGWAVRCGQPCPGGFHPAVDGGGYDTSRIIPTDRVITLSAGSPAGHRWLAYKLPARKIVPNRGAV